MRTQSPIAWEAVPDTAGFTPKLDNSRLQIKKGNTIIHKSVRKVRQSLTKGREEYSSVEYLPDSRKSTGSENPDHDNAVSLADMNFVAVWVHCQTVFHTW
jgi:hypothetical protein